VTRSSTQPPARGAAGRQRKTTPAGLEAVALDLFDRQGFAATTVEQIAAGAGIATRSFFRYFRSKDEVIFGSEEADRERLLGALATDPPASLRLASLEPALVAFAAWLDDEAVRDRVLRRALVVRDNPALWPQMLAVYACWEASLADALAALGEATGAGDAFEAQVVAAAALAVLMVAVRAWCDTPAVRPLPDVVRDAIAVAAPRASALH
jgi:AcrR family transcriptional regulator